MNGYIELHLHLDGAITPDIAKKLGKLQNIPLPEGEALEKALTVQPGCTSLTEFLNCFALPVSLMQTPQGLSEAVYLVQEEMRMKGVIYAEIRWAPQLHCEKGMTQEDAVLAALDGLKRSSLKSGLILCCMRGNDTAAANKETLRLCEKYLREEDGVVAMDLAGAEALFPTSDYTYLFEEARKKGIPYTIHAGEADGPSSIRAALDCCPKRIGHGVRITEDPSLIDEVIEKGITLEMCPTSNLQTCAIPDHHKYPLRALLNAGVRIALCTDDPAIEGTDLPKEYEYMKNAFGLTEDEAETLFKNAVDSAFLPQKAKAELLFNEIR